VKRVTVTPQPSAGVIDAFGLRGEPVALAGGQGDAFLVGDAVVKFVLDAAESEWIQDLTRRLQQDGFRCADPIATRDGRWVHEGWIANEFIGGLRPVGPDWNRVIEIGLRFCDAAEQGRHNDDGVLARRMHRWAVADRVAWDRERLPQDGNAAGLLDELLESLVDVPRETQFVHGDLTGNVFVDDRQTPVILDVSPYIRPRLWAAAIVVVDAVVWNGADMSLLRSFASDADACDLLRRALVFRLVADQLSEDRQAESLVDPYRLAVAAVSERA
jgi:uncharacterized protein (TIGR02569 family)